MKLDDINPPPITVSRHARVAQIIQRMTDVADLLDAIFGDEPIVPDEPVDQRHGMRAVPTDWKRAGAVAE